MILAILLACCPVEDSPEYHLGYEDGCEDGKVRAVDCPRIMDTGLEPTDDNPYSQGYWDGYNDCYEQWLPDFTCS